LRFPNNSNITEDDLVEFKNAAQQYFAYNQDEIDKALNAKKIFEIEECL
jgi:hypothetical protein